MYSVAAKWRAVLVLTLWICLNAVVSAQPRAVLVSGDTLSENEVTLVNSTRFNDRGQMLLYDSFEDVYVGTGRDAWTAIYRNHMTWDGYDLNLDDDNAEFSFADDGSVLIRGVRAAMNEDMIPDRWELYWDGSLTRIRPTGGSNTYFDSQLTSWGQLFVDGTEPFADPAAKRGLWSVLSGERPILLVDADNPPVIDGFTVFNPVPVAADSRGRTVVSATMTENTEGAQNHTLWLFEPGSPNRPELLFTPGQNVDGVPEGSQISDFGEVFINERGNILVNVQENTTPVGFLWFSSAGDQKPIFHASERHCLLGMERSSFTTGPLCRACGRTAVSNTC